MRKTISIMLCAVFCVGAVVIPASAATVNDRTIIDYNDYVSRVQIDGDNDIVTVSLPAYMYGVQADDDNGRRYAEGVDLGSLTFEHNASAGVYFPGSVITKTYLDLKNIPDGSVFTTTGTAWLEVNDLADGVMEGYYWSAVEYFDDRFNSVGVQRIANQSLLLTNGADRIDLTWNVSIEAPQGSRYCVTYFMFYIYNTIPHTTSHVLWYDFAIPQLQMSINSLYRLQEQTGETNKLLENLPGEIGDEIRDVIQEEQNKAELGGNSSVGELESVIPDHSAGFMDALSEFAESMSYTGTEAKLKIPGITMPEIAGVIPKYEIMEDTTLDFGVYIGYLPDGLLLLVQSLLTIALIIYCFKELYDTIAYVLTLRRGADG